ncbi:MAG TPA: hypothetical protein VJ891_11570 [Casimicrobiaceae bacterium]|nr:hypothetical protein [Casimicrobiaceae bacterium]
MNSANYVCCVSIAVSCWALLAASAPAHADIYKCTGKKSLPTYQNFPCQFDSLAAVSAVRTSAAATTPEHGKAAKRVNGGAMASVPRVGMTTEEVRKIWGEPIDISKEEYAKGDIETWRYADSRSIRFDAKGRVQHIDW